MEREYARAKSNKIKRSKALIFLALILITIYFLILGLSLIFNGNLHKIWFSVAIIFIGIYLVTKSIFFHLDSAMYFGLTCLFLGVLSSILFFVEYIYVLESYILAFALVNLIVYFIFRQNFYIISFALLFVEVLLLVVNKLTQNNVVFWVLQSFYFCVILIVVFTTITRLKEK